MGKKVTNTEEAMAMYYKNNSELPESVKKILPISAQDLYRKAFNNACEKYKKAHAKLKETAEAEEKFRKEAWAAVEKQYEKIKDKWENKKDKKREKKK